jgi:hypothetical protein
VLYPIGVKLSCFRSTRLKALVLQNALNPTKAGYFATKSVILASFMRVFGFSVAGWLFASGGEGQHYSVNSLTLQVWDRQRALSLRNHNCVGI